MLLRNYLKQTDIICVKKWWVYYNNETTLFYDMSDDEPLRYDSEIKKELSKKYGRLKINSVVMFGTSDCSEICFYLK